MSDDADPVEPTELDRLRAERDGWRRVAMHALSTGDFGDTPPIEFLPETAEPAYDKTDRTPELVDELRQRPLITDIQRWVQQSYDSDRARADDTICIDAMLGPASVLIQYRPSHGGLYKFSIAHFDDVKKPQLFSPREVSFELLLRYLDFVIAGYRLGKIST